MFVMVCCEGDAAVGWHLASSKWFASGDPGLTGPCKRQQRHAAEPSTTRRNYAEVEDRVGVASLCVRAWSVVDGDGTGEPGRQSRNGFRRCGGHAEAGHAEIVDR